MIALAILLILQAPLPMTRFACEPTSGTLLWEVSGVLVAASASGVSLRDGILAAPAKPLAPSGTPTPVILRAADPTLVARGTVVEECSGRSCRPAGRLPVTAWAATPQADGYVLAAGAPKPGLYRASYAHPTELVPLAEGEVLVLCPHGEGAWALVTVGATASLIWTRPEAVTHQQSFAEALLGGLRPDTPLGTIRRALAAAATLHAGERGRVLLTTARDERPTVRALAAAELGSWDGGDAAATALWLLAHDTDPTVRRAALDGTEAGLATLAEPAATARLALFLEDPSQDIAWRARDLLLARTPELALLDAPSTYKLDALAILAAGNLERTQTQAALRLLAADEDPQVRMAAQTVRESFAP